MFLKDAKFLKNVPNYCMDREILAFAFPRTIFSKTEVSQFFSP